MVLADRVAAVDEAVQRLVQRLAGAEAAIGRKRLDMAEHGRELVPFLTESSEAVGGGRDCLQRELDAQSAGIDEERRHHNLPAL